MDPSHHAAEAGKAAGSMMMVETNNRQTERSFAKGEPVQFKTLFGVRSGTIAEVVPAGAVPSVGVKGKARRVESCIVAVNTPYHDAADRPRTRIDHHWMDVSTLRDRSAAVQRTPVREMEMEMEMSPSF
jgi:hypothetical protein